MCDPPPLANGLSQFSLNMVKTSWLAKLKIQIWIQYLGVKFIFSESPSFVLICINYF